MGDYAIAVVACNPAPAFATLGELVINSDTLLTFVGRVHPVLVHFPIGLLLAAAFFEMVHGVIVRNPPAEGESRISVSARACLVLGVVAAGLAAWSGWVRQDLDPMGGSVEGTVSLHRWLAVAAVALGVVAILLSMPARTSVRAARVYRLALFASAGLVGVAGHFGGALTWGPDYLTQVFYEDAAPAPVEADPMPVDNAGAGPSTVRTVDFARDIEPIFASYCYDCHGPRRQKGDLRLDRRGDALARQNIVPGDPDASEVVRRIALHPDDDDFMPRDDDPLDDGQIALLRTWIAEGASWDGPPPPTTAEPASETETHQPSAEAASQLPALTPDAQAALERLGRLGATITPVSAASEDLDVHLGLLGPRFTDEHAADLARLADRVVWLNLAGTGVTDATGPILAAMPRLERLHLERTAITDAGVAALVGLEDLRYLNLHSTAVTNAALVHIAEMPALEQVYLWDTAVTADEADLLRLARPGLTVIDRPD